jgi:hypothetical protein
MHQAGGRIFYPAESNYGVLCKPVEYDGAQPNDLVPFGLREDMNWRRLMERKEAAGKEGYAGNEISTRQGEVSPVSERTGVLWEFASRLEEEGIVIDSKSYSACFRVNRKHQTGEAKVKFDKLLQGDIAHPPELATSTNLGCIDYYPVDSGKKNW